MLNFNFSKPVAKKNNIITRDTYIAFMKNDKFVNLKNLSMAMCGIWLLASFITGGFIKFISILLLIISVAAFFYIPTLARKHANDQFVIEYGFGLVYVNEGLTKRIPWQNVVCFVNSLSTEDKGRTMESTFYIITANEHIKLDSKNYTQKQLDEVYSILAPYLSGYGRFVSGENLVTIEMRDINKIRQNFMGSRLYIQ